jgi:hypothetical protein
MIDAVLFVSVIGVIAVALVVDITAMIGWLVRKTKEKNR